jgi:cyclopropane fatty-acyl-phospholipid synthase-like methyltransferase
MNQASNQSNDHRADTYRETVRRYYDETAELYLEYLGPTLQGMLVTPEEGPVTAHASNLYLAGAAGIEPGQHILDAGCGLAGPSIDIAGAIPDITIDGITISPTQAALARQRVAEAGLERRIRIVVADYHALPFPAATYDVILFLESSGHSEERWQLFQGVHRLLKPGGRLFIKDVFRQVRPLSPEEEVNLATFNRVFVYRTPLLDETLQLLANIGFTDVESHDLTARASFKHFTNAVVRFLGPIRMVTPLGRRHLMPMPVPQFPIVFAEVKAGKP